MTGNLSAFEKKFYVVGVSFKRTDTRERSKFSVTPDQAGKTYQAAFYGLDHYMILSTCNRTEIYGLAPCRYVPLAFLQQLSGASHEEVAENAYVKEGEDAVRHLLTVASGLDSQIPGDYEIIAQIRGAFAASKAAGRANGYLERVVSQANQISKAIKNTTGFSDGTVSVSYSVARQIGAIIQSNSINRICVVGLGKIGANTVKYLRQHAPEAEITLVNRNTKKLSDLAETFDASAFGFDDLGDAVKENDIVIIATSADQPVLFNRHLEGTLVKFVFDLSMPHNVADEVYERSDLEVFDVDQISAAVNATLDRRLAEIPKVKAIVAAKAQELFDWETRRKLRSTRVSEEYNSILTITDVVANSTNSVPRKLTCSMANQCCDAGATGARLFGATCSA